MSSFEIKQKDILVTNTNRARAREHPAWRGGRHFLEGCRSRLPASVEFINKASMCVCEH